MSQPRHSAGFLVAALAALLAGSPAAPSGLVLCLGADGHRAIELEHGGRGCRTPGSSRQAPAISVHPTDGCLDLPVSSAVRVAPLSLDPRSPGAVLAASPQPPPRCTARLPGWTAANTGPRALVPHLRSTVLLV